MRFIGRPLFIPTTTISRFSAEIVSGVGIVTAASVRMNYLRQRDKTHLNSLANAYRKGPCGKKTWMADKPDFVGPCGRCGRPVKNVKLIGSLIVGRDCRKKMLAEGFSETVMKCPLCRSPLSDKHILSVKEGQVVLEPTVQRRSLDEWGTRSKFIPPPESATFQLLSVEVLSKDEEREGNDDDGETVDSGDDESGRGDSPEDVSGTGGDDGEAKSAEEVHRADEHARDSTEDA